MLLVKITDTSTRSVLMSRHRTDDPGEAQERAIEKHYGRAAFFNPDRDLGLSYGQIFRNVRSSDGWSATAVTGRVRIEVESAGVRVG